MNISDNLRQSLGMYDWVHAKSLMINTKSVVCLKNCVFFVDYIYPLMSALFPHVLWVCENLRALVGFMPPAGLLLLRLRLRSMARPLAALSGQNLWRGQVAPNPKSLEFCS